MMTIKLQGGLGNQLFQLAAFDYITTDLQVKQKMYLATRNVHSEQDYFSSIFSSFTFQKMQENDEINESIQVNENDSEINLNVSYIEKDWSFLQEKIKVTHKNIVLFGYFQHWKYVTSSFIDKLVLPETNVLDGAFLHIRGGDYVDHDVHYVDLKQYYNNAIKCFPPETRIYVFTNDREYAKTFELSNFTIVEESNELLSLALMSRCKAGGICANSTFSWWAGVLNKGKIIIPDTWSKEGIRIVREGYFHPRFVVTSTSTSLTTENRECFYINLDSRVDRKILFEEEFKDKSIKPKRFSAIPHEFGLAGCGLSHLKLLQYAKQENLTSIIIFEDDFQFSITNEEFDIILQNLPSDFDVVMLSYNLKKEGASYNEYFGLCEEVQTASGYIVSSKFFDALINNLDVAMKVLCTDYTKHWSHANDQYWKILQPQSRWYYSKKRVGIQRSSWSDCEQKFVDYKV
jgi:hypothetical protein